MLKEERQAFIMKQINLHNKVLSSDLSVQLSVSEDTIRRDLNELAETGKVLKVYGGALSKSFNYPFEPTDTYARDAKKEIAKKVAKLIHSGMVILAGGGTTMIEVARNMPDNLTGTFFTVSPLVALEMAERSSLDVILIGGRLSKDSHINTGAQVINQLTEIKADLCLLGTNGLSLEEGITDSDWEVVQVKKAMIKCSQKTAIVSISEKLETVQKMKVCPLGAVHYLITDINPGDEALKEYSRKMELI